MNKVETGTTALVLEAEVLESTEEEVLQLEPLGEDSPLGSTITPKESEVASTCR
jgi:hypothetical protein